MTVSGYALLKKRPCLYGDDLDLPDGVSQHIRPVTTCEMQISRNKDERFGLIILHIL